MVGHSAEPSIILWRIISFFRSSTHGDNSTLYQWVLQNGCTKKRRYFAWNCWESIPKPFSLGQFPGFLSQRGVMVPLMVPSTVFLGYITYNRPITFKSGNNEVLIQWRFVEGKFIFSKITYLVWKTCPIWIEAFYMILLSFSPVCSSNLLRLTGPLRLRVVPMRYWCNRASLR